MATVISSIAVHSSFEWVRLLTDLPSCLLLSPFAEVSEQIVFRGACCRDRGVTGNRENIPFYLVEKYYYMNF